MSKKLEPEILNNREELEDMHGELLKRYDWYLIRDLLFLKNKNNLRIFYLNSEKLYVVVTGNDFRKVFNKKLNKWQNKQLYAHKD